MAAMNLNVQWLIERIGTNREVDLSADALDYRRDRVVLDEVPEGFVDVSALLRPGIYLLLQHGRVVFVGKASGPMLARIAAARAENRPSILPGVPFDSVLIREVHPDRLEAERTALIARFRPKHNSDAALRSHHGPVDRR